MSSLYLDTSTPAANSPNVARPQSTFAASFYRALTRVHGRQDAPSSLEYLFEEAYAGSTGPSWGSRIAYGAGWTYLSFLGLGGAWGVLTSFTPGTSAAFLRPVAIHAAAAASGPTSALAVPWKLRWNAILNNVTSRGPFAANNAASVALTYNLLHGAIIKGLYADQYDVWTSTASAGLAGILFRSASGWRSAMRAGAMCSAGMLAWSVADVLLNEDLRQ